METTPISLETRTGETSFGDDLAESWPSYLQHTRARGADERADRHVDVSRPALIAVEALLVARLRDQLAQGFQVPLVLLPFRGRHGARGGGEKYTRPMDGVVSSWALLEPRAHEHLVRRSHESPSTPRLQNRLRCTLSLVLLFFLSIAIERKIGRR